MPAHPAAACSIPLQTSGLLPPSLATFCPWDLALLVYVGFGTHEEVAFYSLRQKQVCVSTCLVLATLVSRALELRIGAMRA